jgi:hypothetical protein
MSAFENNLIERLTTALVDVQSQNQLGECSIALAKNLSIGERENGALGEQIVLWVFFAGCSLKWPTTEILSTAEANLKRWAT